jgi:4-hydroxy-tetrahydrodipicolinate synthase
MSLRSTLSGTGVALVTPFKSDLSIDFPALEKVINFVINSGVEYIVSLGTTGETPTLSKEEKIDILEFTYSIVKDRAPVVVGIGGNDTATLIKYLQSFPLDKAVAVLSASPYYSKPSQEGLFQHYKALAEASPLSLILYNVPGRTGRNLNATTTIRLANEVPNVAGIKEASDDVNQFMQLIKNRPSDFLVVSGDDALILPQIACGADGVISVAANTFPKQFSEMIRLGLAGKLAEARSIHYKLLDGYDLLFEENNPAGAKAFLYELGLIENVLRLPLTPVSDELQGRIKLFLSSL